MYKVGTVAAVSGDKARCKAGDVIVRVDPRYFRPTEVKSDDAAARRDSLVKQAGYQVFDDHE